jgi:hypothetical protein
MTPAERLELRKSIGSLVTELNTLRISSIGHRKLRHNSVLGAKSKRIEPCGAASHKDDGCGSASHKRFSSSNCGHCLKLVQFSERNDRIAAAWNADTQQGTHGSRGLI